MNPRPVKPGQVRNALLNALDRHGIAPTTAESIWYDLVTGNDPRPEHLPETFTFKGIPLVWPAGRHTRAVQPEEMRALNRALRANNTREADLISGDNTAQVARLAYSILYQRTLQADFGNTTLVEDSIAQVVAEATGPREPEAGLDDSLEFAVARMTLAAPQPQGEHPCRKTKAAHGPHTYMRQRILVSCPGVAASAEDARTALEREIDQMMADLDSIG